MNAAATRVRCPTCRKSIEWTSSNAFRPFCSKRCRLIDLGEWFNESHRIAGDAASAPADDADGLS